MLGQESSGTGLTPLDGLWPVMTGSLLIVQHNVNRQKVASHQLRDFCAENRVNITLIQEPIINGDKVYGFEDQRLIHNGQNVGSTIIIINTLRIIEMAQYNSQHVTSIKVKGKREVITIVSAYFKYDILISSFIKKLRPILVSNSIEAPSH